MPDLDRLRIQIEMAAMLLALGRATVDEIRSFFRDTGVDDDAVLANIMTQVDQRIARRS